MSNDKLVFAMFDLGFQSRLHKSPYIWSKRAVVIQMACPLPSTNKKVCNLA